MNKCPVCGQEMGSCDMICRECYAKVTAVEGPRRESVMHAWGRGLMVLIAVVLYIRGLYGLIEPDSYMAVSEAIGLEKSGTTVHYLNTSLLLVTATLYGIAWMGSYIWKAWHARLCLVALALYAAGQALLQACETVRSGDVALRLALVIFWSVVPVFQYAALHLGEHMPGTVPEKGGDGDAAADNRDERKTT